MTKAKSTKRALLMSGLALIMCVSMLIGSTYAWFTDSVTSSGNIIKSGTLDVTMEWADGTKAVPADDSTDWKNAADGAIFKSELWEPGYTEVRHIKIANEGTLALKYQLNIIANGEVSELSDVIDVYYVDPAVQVANRTQLTDANKLGTLTDVLANISTTASGNLKADEAHTITLALKMQESAGNEYQGLSIGSDFSVQLLATQLTHESDSFDNQYDKDAVYADAYVTDAAGLADAIADGGIIALMDDIEVSSINVPKGVTATINLNGNDISGTSTKDSGNQSSFVVKGNLTVEGTGTVSHNHTGANMGWGNLTAAFSVEGGSLTLGEGVSVVNNGGSDMAYAVDVNTTLGTTTLTVNGATIYSAYTGVRIFNNHKTAKGIVNFNDGFIEGDNRDIWHQVASSTASAENGVVNIADGYNYTTEATSNGGAKYFFTDYLVATDDDGLDDAIKDGATTLVLSSGNYIIPDSAQGKTLTIVGSGDTVIATQDDGSYEGCDYSLDGAKVTFENVTINTDSRTYTGYARCSATYNNCTINGAYTLYGESVFNNCTFNVTGDVYNIWTWGGKNVEFNGCTFNTSGKSILVYNQSCDVYVNDCVFNDSTNGTGFTKSALETGVDGVGPKYNIYINDTTVNGFAENDKCVGYKNIVGNKNSMTNEYLNIVIDGVDVY